jgi:hypothetical protein
VLVFYFEYRKYKPWFFRLNFIIELAFADTDGDGLVSELDRFLIMMVAWIANEHTIYQVIVMVTELMGVVGTTEVDAGQVVGCHGNKC